jgi:hypothetical protein
MLVAALFDRTITPLELRRDLNTLVTGYLSVPQTPPMALPA